ncbi:MAG TPA: DUF3943 domain-containing protein [Solimonas sp.]|nr:DUF3943 domain-containing protein [Solimonas sp.]
MRTRSRKISAFLLLYSAATPAFAAEELDPAAQEVAPTAFNNEPPAPVLDWGRGEGRSWWVPAADIVAFDVLLNLFDRAYFKDSQDFDVTWDSIEENATGGWVYDDDGFTVNQIGHPYQGSMYHGFARSAGLGYWESSAYTLLGSAFWEITGETTPPSVNDQITTGFGGSFLGEPLFRLASLLLESGSSSRPSAWREWGAAAISPSLGFNRWAYGKRFDGVFRSHDPAVHTAAQVGMTLNADVRSNVNRRRDPTMTEAAISQDYDRGEVSADFNVAYGLPGKPGYTYNRPFDYFNFQIAAATGNALESVISRGLLYGRPYGTGENYRGIWGLYGTYDYIAPQIFRVSSTGVALGTTGQWWASENVALQGTALLGAGYASGGVINGTGDRDYHRGLTPQGLLAFRVIVGDRLLLEATGRDYYITDRASEENGFENIARGDVALTLRVWDLHGLTLRYVISHRDAHYDAIGDTQQTVNAVNLGYTYLGHKRFGAVDWRRSDVAPAP